MGAKKYFKNQFRTHMFLLEHENESDFYVGCWQENKSCFPLLCVRTIIFLGCLGILLASTIMTGLGLSFLYWFIYLTHWGVFAITVASGSALAVSCRAYFGGPIDVSFALPWYVKLQWVTYNTAMAVAIFITIFYYTLLAPSIGDMVIDHPSFNVVLDPFVHGVNSVLMLMLLLTSRMPSRWLHFYHPLCFALTYMVFSIIYYYAGGTDPFGSTSIYPMLAWSDPLPTSLLVILCAIFIILVHLLVVGLTALRNYLTRSVRRGFTLQIN